MYAWYITQVIAKICFHKSCWAPRSQLRDEIRRIIIGLMIILDKWVGLMWKKFLIIFTLHGCTLWALLLDVEHLFIITSAPMGAWNKCNFTPLIGKYDGTTNQLLTNRRTDGLIGKLQTSNNWLLPWLRPSVTHRRVERFVAALLHPSLAQGYTFFNFFSA